MPRLCGLRERKEWAPNKILGLFLKKAEKGNRQTTALYYDILLSCPTFIYNLSTAICIYIYFFSFFNVYINILSPQKKKLKSHLKA